MGQIKKFTLINREISARAVELCNFFQSSFHDVSIDPPRHTAIFFFASSARYFSGTPLAASSSSWGCFILSSASRAGISAAASGAGAVFAQVSEVALFVAARAHELELLARHTYLDVLSTTIVLLAVAPLFIHGLRRVDRRHFLEADREARRGGLVADLAQLPLLIFGRVGQLMLWRRPARSA